MKWNIVPYSFSKAVKVHAEADSAFAHIGPQKILSVCLQLELHSSLAILILLLWNTSKDWEKFLTINVKDHSVFVSVNNMFYFLEQIVFKLIENTVPAPIKDAASIQKLFFDPTHHDAVYLKSFTHVWWE